LNAILGATVLPGTPWEYLKVGQEEYSSLQPTLFADLIALGDLDLKHSIP
jgi:hypothetical protein